MRRASFATWIDRSSGETHRISGIDLLVAGDGRYSLIRQHVLGGPEVPHFLDVCLYRVLFPAGPDCPIDDYGQWFNGPARLLAFRVPGDFVYCAGSFPLPEGGSTPDAMKQSAFLSQVYSPAGVPPSREAAYLIDAVVAHVDRIHWARLQEGSVTYSDRPGILLAGDAAHPMVPTLGQGATQACEDACVIVDEIRAALASGAPLADLPRPRRATPGRAGALRGRFFARGHGHDAGRGPIPSPARARRRATRSGINSCGSIATFQCSTTSGRPDPRGLQRANHGQAEWRGTFARGRRCRSKSAAPSRHVDRSAAPGRRVRHTADLHGRLIDRPASPPPVRRLDIASGIVASALRLVAPGHYVARL